MFVANINAQTDEWRKINISTNQNLNEICFINESIGFICGDTGTILKTIDSGNTWTNINSPNNDNITSIAFTDELNGAVLTSIGVNDKKFHVTTNGGLSWNLKYVGFGGGFCFPETLQAHNEKIFVGGNGCFYGDAIAIYENDTFTLDTMLSGSGSISHFDFITDGIGFANSKNNGIYKTINGGNSWSNIVSTDFIQEIYDIAFVDENIGYCVGKDTVINGGFYPAILFKTTDGGVSWTDIVGPLFVTPTLTDITVFNTDSIISVGAYVNQFSDNGTIWHNFVDSQWFNEDFSIDTLNPRLKKNDVIVNNGCIYILGDKGFLAKNCIDTSINVGIHSIKKNLGFNVFPNPSNGKIILEINSIEKTNCVVEVYTMNGQLVFNETLNNFNGKQKKQLDLSSLSESYYIFTIEYNHKKIATKILIKK